MPTSCLGCGVDFPSNVPRSKKYCGDGCRPRCAAGECDRAATSLNGLCGKHNWRLKAYGDAGTEPHRQKVAGLKCSVEGCGQPRRKVRWCAAHYSQWRRTGVEPVPFGYKWSEREPCLVCGKTATAYGRRRFCSDACRALYRFHDGNVPSRVACIACGVEIDLAQSGKGGTRKQANTKLCKACRGDYRKYKMSARELARRDGSNCGICGKPVNMTLRRQDSNMCPSVDHVIPRAHGGTHDPANLQLAHLYCNQVKSDRWAA